MNPKKIPFRHIAVEGPIGVGKTSLVQLLADRFEGVMVLEDITNPFLPDFYEGRPGAAFQVQIYFLLSRFQQQREIRQMNLFQRLVLADYTFPKDRIFAYLNLDDTDLRVYEKLYPVLEQEVPTPDLVIYMQGSISVLLERIARRGRDFERAIDPDYLRPPQRGLLVLLLPLPGDAAAGRQHRRDRLRQPTSGPRATDRPDRTLPPGNPGVCPDRRPGFRPAPVR